MTRQFRFKILVTLYKEHKQRRGSYIPPETLAEELGGVDKNELMDQLKRLEREGYVEFTGVHNDPQYSSRITTAGRSIVEDAIEDSLESPKPPIGF